MYSKRPKSSHWTHISTAEGYMSAYGVEDVPRASKFVKLEQRYRAAPSLYLLRYGDHFVSLSPNHQDLSSPRWLCMFSSREDLIKYVENVLHDKFVDQPFTEFPVSKELLHRTIPLIEAYEDDTETWTVTGLALFGFDQGQILELKYSTENLRTALVTPET